MCLIVYSPAGELMPREVHDTARRDNSDGIGVMSESGVERFLGRRAGKRAWRHIRRLAERGEPYGVHYRWATHGAVTLRNTHPFQGGTDGAVHVMHNGIIALTAEDANEQDSDTSLFVREWMQRAPDPEVGVECKAYYESIEKLIGYGSKLLVMGESGTFQIVNEFAGVWHEGLWYSNEYSLPNYRWNSVTSAGYTYDDYEDEWAKSRSSVLRGRPMREDKSEYECRGCGTVHAEEDLWALEECPYCGTVRGSA